jgi:sterol desaturase/sphingolipid hydroxylase (fatty acid hydroxylase superfamily)
MTLGQWALVAILAALLAEVLAGKHRNLYRRHDLLSTFSCILLGRLTSPLAALAIAGTFALALPGFRGALADLPFWPSFLVLLVVEEFCFYWVHRMAHDPKNHPILYGMHRTHHASPYLNITVMGRINVFWHFIVPTAWVKGLAIYLGMLNQAGALMLLILAWNTATHSDYLRWDDLFLKYGWSRKLLRALQYVVVTPGLHHTHHGWGKDGKTYRNYATMLSFYDRLFGTLHVPEGRPAHYGLPGKDVHWTEEVFFPLVGKKGLIGRIDPGTANAGAD